MLDFTDKVIVITGGARGIGRCYAELLAGRGASVVIADLGCETGGEGASAEPGEALARSLNDRGPGRAASVTATVATEDGAAAIVQAALDAFGRIDCLVNNAGIIRMGGFPETPIGVFRAHMDVHFFGTVLMSQAAWPHLVQSRGRILNTVSGAVNGALDMIHYASAKGAIYSFTRNLAVVGASCGVKVNAISPAADTRMIDVPGMAEALPPGTIDFLRAQMGPHWIAPVAAYLLHESCPLNGEVLSAGGGSVSRMAMVNSAGIAADTLSVEDVASRIDEILDLAGAAPAPLATGHPAVTG